MICLFLIQLVLPASVGAGMADQTNSLKELFKIPVQARLERSTEEGFVFVSWSLKQGTGEAPVGGQAAFDETTNEFLYYVEEYNAPRLAVEMKQADCQKHLETIMARMLPAKQSKVKLNGAIEKFVLDDGTYYSFCFQRQEGQIPVQDNGLYFTFNASTGRVTSFQLEWYVGKLPDAAGLLSAAAANSAFAENIPVQLEWTKIASGLDDLKFNLRPVYRIADFYAVDAKSGELVQLLPSEVIPYRFDPKSIPGNYGAVTTAVTITAAAAESAVRQGAGIPAGYKLDGSYPNWSWGEQGRTTDFVFVDTNYEVEIHVSVDMVAGRILNINRFINSEEISPRFNYSSAKDKALEFCKIAAPREFADLKLVEQDSSNDYPGYRFIRYIYGIPFTGNGVQVEVNEYTGDISRYYFAWERNLNIPSLTGIMEPAKARTVIAQNNQMDLVYSAQQNFDDKTDSFIGTVRLVYIPRTSAEEFFDAVTGAKIEKGRVPAGIKGHWSETSFRNLGEMGIVNSNTAIDPNRPITRGEFARMLVLATYLTPTSVQKPTFSDVGLSNPLIGYIERAYANGIIKGSGGKFNPDKSITRQEAAVILVKALKSEGRIDPDIQAGETAFKDKNYIALWAAQDVKMAAYLGYIKGFNGYFKPLNSITWAEAAALMNAYINNE